MLTLVTHNDPRWDAVYRAHGRENGAATYSRELCQFQVPVWASELGDLNVTISTCPLLIGEPIGPKYRPLPGGHLAVQYLHEYPYEMPLNKPLKVQRHLASTYDRVLFVTAYKKYHSMLVNAGLDAIYLPMSIDTHQVREYRHREGYPRIDNKLAYFGNVKREKRKQFKELSGVAEWAGFELVHLQKKQPEAWEALSPYAYGVGVGRCAMEMAALGLRVLISGRGYGGLVMNQSDYLAQQSTNFNGRITTGPQSLREALERLPDSLVWSPMDSREAVEWLKTEIWEKFHYVP